jgi:hypothetical protein
VKLQLVINLKTAKALGLICYARTPSGDWKIAAIDQASQ